MSGTKHSDTEVEYILDTETWIGPYEGTPLRACRGGRRTLIVRSGLKAEALPDLRPAQWSKLIFNATVNAVAALTGLPHDSHFAARGAPDRPRPPRPRPGRRGQGRRRGGGHRAARGPVGDERARDAARVGPLSVDARGRRSAQADRDRPHHRLARPRGRSGTECRCRCTRRCTASSRRRRSPGETRGVKPSSAPGGVMTSRKDRSARGAARDAHRGRGGDRRDRACGVADADRDRLGVRRQGQHGAVRRACARRGEDPGQADQREGRRQRAASSGSSPATRRTTTRPRRRRAPRACSGKGADIDLHDLRRRLRDTGRPGVDQRGQAHGRAVHRHRPDGAEALRRRRAGSRSASATSRRTRARRWRSTRGARAGRRPRSPRTRVLVYFKNVVQAFKARFTQLGGKIVAQESYATGAEQRQHRGQPRLNGAQGRRDRDVDRRFGELPAARRRGFARSTTRRRSSTRGPVTASTGSRRSRR